MWNCYCRKSKCGTRLSAQDISKSSVNAISRKSHHFERVGYLLYGIYLSHMTKDMLCFLSSQSDSFLIHDMISVCSHNNTTGATSRVEQHQSSPLVFCFSVGFCRSLLVLLTLFFWPLTFGFRCLYDSTSWSIVTIETETEEWLTDSWWRQ